MDYRLKVRDSLKYLEENLGGWRGQMLSKVSFELNRVMISSAGVIAV
ncbi:hypothetical protein [Desulfosporosinus hippei]|uniref:Uncharacterized protein n=1 Tax=Desulfosporosinus hippei DSM 8344 TaxID=1121419 RepID=A0A1G7WVP3_9FIRM|nr:hypothetical protein [Desulfosporosinus hippei]SDG76022.1 hypothetical protein SAMN05443529_10628 [Desulfosporosinus hippei DSM 8344]